MAETPPFGEEPTGDPHNHDHPSAGHEGHPSPPAATPGKVAMWLFLATEVMFWSTGMRLNCSRVTLVADSVELTSTPGRMVPLTLIASSAVALSAAPTLTVVALPRLTVTFTGCPTGAPSLLLSSV